jgi:ubiquitin-activating enzyme E1
MTAGNPKNEFILSLGRSLNNRQNSFDDCIEWAYRKWEEEFNYKANKIIDNYPLDTKLEDGSPYWVGSVRPPTPQTFDSENAMHMEFIIAIAHLRAYTIGVINDEHKSKDADEWKQKKTDITNYVKALKPSPYIHTNVSKETSVVKKSEQKLQITYNQAELDEIVSRLPNPKDVNVKPTVCDFEKDDDTNFHIDCIYTWSSIRAQMYAIKLETRLKTKIIVGSIIPAIITTTAFVSGFACLELIKQHQPGKKLEDFQCMVANLAVPSLQFSAPNEKTNLRAGKIGYHEWTRVDIPPSVVTFGDLDKWMSSYGIFINTIGVCKRLLWLGMKTPDSLNKRIVDAYQECMFGQNPIPDYVYHFVMQIDAKDNKGKPLVNPETQEALMPTVCFWLKKPPQSIATVSNENKGKRKSANASKDTEKKQKI